MFLTENEWMEIAETLEDALAGLNSGEPAHVYRHKTIRSILDKIGPDGWAAFVAYKDVAIPASLGAEF